MENLEIKNLENQYREYIDNHRKNVQKAWDLMKSNNNCVELINRHLFTTTELLISMMDDIIKQHDMSKYSIFEFAPYRKNFYPLNEEEKASNTDEFERAWKHHYENNPHHWDGWYKSGSPDMMPLIHVVEMICDWEAMGYTFGNNSLQYYEKNKMNIHLGDKQRIFAEELMNTICV